MAEKQVVGFGVKRPGTSSSSARSGGGTSRDRDEGVYSIQGRHLDPRESYGPPRLLPGTGGGEEILIAEYPHPLEERLGPQGASLDDPPSTSTSDTGPGARRAIQWRAPRPGVAMSPLNRKLGGLQSAPVQGILRRTGAGRGLPTKFEPAQITPTPGGMQFSAGGMAPSSGRSDETEDDEEGTVSEDEDHEEDSYELYSPLDKADLKSLSKNQIIEMWRASELDLRRQLSQALKAKDELGVALSRTDTPAPSMMVEFDQVQL